LLAAQYSANIDTGETAPQGTDTSGMNFGANWSWGPLFLAATYDVIFYADAGSAGRPRGRNPDQKMLQLGGTFDFSSSRCTVPGPIRATSAPPPHLPVSTTACRRIVPTGIGNYDNTAWMLGVTVPLFGGNLRGSYQYWTPERHQRLAQFGRTTRSGALVTTTRSHAAPMYIGYAQRKWNGQVTQAAALACREASQIFDRSQFASGHQF
jgi:hypothetical protein